MHLVSCIIITYCVHTGVPQSVMVSPVNSTTVTVSWSEVQCFNGSGAATHYLVQYLSMCSGTVRNVTTGIVNLTVSGLTPNTAIYTFRVAAVRTNGVTGPFSNRISISEPGMWLDIVYIVVL